MVKIRLARHGRHKRPLYRIVVADSRSPRDGRFIEVLGTYDPLATSAGVRLDAERAQGWLARGAQLTDTVRQLFKRSGVRAASPRAV
jgi:small subunit ribosomal protein S16